MIMPLTSLSLLYTWSIESLLFSLLSLGIVTHYITLSIFVISAVSLIAYIFLASQDLTKYMIVVAVSQLCVVTGIFLSCIFNMNNISEIILICISSVQLLTSMGCIFAAREESTTLFFHPRGHYAIGVPIVLVNLYCLQYDQGVTRIDLDMVELGLAWSFTVIGLNFSPYDAIAHIGNFVLEGGMGLWFLLIARVNPTYILLICNIVTVTYFLQEWLSFIVLMITGKQVPDTKQLLTSGPWIETIVFAMIIVLSIVLMILFSIQGKIYFAAILIVPVILSAMWIAMFWIFRPKLSDPEPTTRPTNIPNPVNVQRPVNWPRVRFMPKDL